MKIFLDMDGVIMDFVGGIFKWYQTEGLTHEDITGWNKIVTLTCEAKGMTKSEFWKGLTDEFWEGLEFLPWAEDLIALLEPYKPVLLTSPGSHGAGGKQAAIRKGLKQFWRDDRYLIGPAKSYVAHPEAVLIDDSEKNVDAFSEAGGRAILFPQPWNRFGSSRDPVKFIYYALEVTRRLK